MNCGALAGIRPPGGPMKIVDLAKRTAKVWSGAQAPTFGAAVSYYTLLPLAPLLVIALAVAGMVFGERAASGELEGEIRDTVGPSVAQSIQDILRNAHRPQTGTLAIVISVVVLLL